MVGAQAYDAYAGNQNGLLRGYATREQPSTTAASDMQTNNQLLSVEV